MKPLMLLSAPGRPTPRLIPSARCALWFLLLAAPHLVTAMAASWATPALAQPVVPMASAPSLATQAALAAAGRTISGAPGASAVARDVTATTESDGLDLWKLRKEHEDEDTELRLEIATARLQKKLTDIRNGKDTDDSGIRTPMVRPGGMFGSPMMGTPSAPAPARVEKVTSIDDIFTSPKINDNHPSATIRLPSGRTMTVMAGTRVAGLGTIASVTRDQVLYLDATGHEMALPFSSGTEQ
jgi:type IV pilus biogenesis protein PilP